MTLNFPLYVLFLDGYRLTSPGVHSIPAARYAQLSDTKSITFFLRLEAIIYLPFLLLNEMISREIYHMPFQPALSI